MPPHRYPAAPQRYHKFRSEDYRNYKFILIRNQWVRLMDYSGKTFRIFVSSTFDDMKEERNALQKRVFPRLRNLCMEKGRRFQAIDLRWGVSEEASINQKTMRICIEELKRCQRMSPKPNFIVLLGNRYGWRPAPEIIDAMEFIELYDRILDPEKKVLLNKRYERDDNAVPPIFFLKPRVLKIPSGSEPEEIEQIKKAETEEWKVEEFQITTMLRDAATLLGYTGAKLLKYIASATEQEIEAGALSVENASDHVFCFFRSISGLPLDRSAGMFMDFDETTGKPDDEANHKLKELKERLRSRLPGHIYEYDAQWQHFEGEAFRDEAGLGKSITPITTEHLDRFCDDAYIAISKIIEEEIAGATFIDEYERELDKHEEVCRNRATCFSGRQSIMRNIEEYLLRPATSPMTLYGEGGIGKSAVVARAVQLAQVARPKANIVYRFIGVTPLSTDIRSLIESISRQITRAYGGKEEIKSYYEELVQDFPEKLKLASDDQPLLLFIDALDQLSTSYNAHTLAWLPMKLPRNVHIVLTTRPGVVFNCIKLNYLDNLVEIDPLPKSEGTKILDLWLASVGRTLQKTQKAVLLGNFEKTGNPLYLRMAFTEATLWTSSMENIALNDDVKGIIKNLYLRLSRDSNHGSIFTSHALGYLAASRFGLSEDEIVDILSQDKEVIADFARRSPRSPSIEEFKSLPVSVWSRFYFDLEPYLTVRSAEDTHLLAFYHLELKEVATAEYLSGKDGIERNRSLAEYFNLVADAPIGFGFRNITKDWDRWGGHPRALSELPYHTAMAQMWDELFATLTDFRFLENKSERVNKNEIKNYKGHIITSYGGVFALQKDYELALKFFPNGD